MEIIRILEHYEETQQGRSLMNLLKLPMESNSLNHSQREFLSYSKYEKKETINKWDETVSSFQKVLMNLPTKSIMIERNGYEIQELEKIMDLYIPFIENLHAVLKNMDRWVIPVIVSVIRDLTLLAGLIAKCVNNYRTEEIYDKVIPVVHRFFSMVLTDKKNKEVSKKWGIYCIGNQLFYLYLITNRINMIEFMLKSLKGSDGPDLQEMPGTIIAGHMFYKGVFNFANGEYEEAEKALFTALSNCTNQESQELILSYIIIIGLYKGYYPRKNVLSILKYGPIYIELIDTIYYGDVGAFLEILQSRYKLWARSGMYVMLQKLLILVYRNMIANIYEVLRPESQIPLEMLDNIIRGLYSKIPEMNLHYILSQLRAQKYLKGYISHVHNILVLSIKDPFPKILDIRKS